MQVFYQLDARRLFGEEVGAGDPRDPTSRSTCWASAGWISTTPQENHVLRALPGRGLLGAAAHLHHVRRLQEDRAGDGYRGRSGRGVGDGGEADGKGGEKALNVDSQELPTDVQTLQKAANGPPGAKVAR